MDEKTRQDYEEYQISPLFTAAANAISSLFKSVASILVWFGKVTAKFFYEIVSSWKTVIPMALGGAILLSLYNQSLTPAFENTLIVLPRFSIEDQLISDVDYLNSLVGDDGAPEMAEILHVSLTEAASIQSFNLKTEVVQTEKIKYINHFIGTIDTMLAKAPYVKELFQDEDLARSYSRYKIVVRSIDPAIFSKIEAPLIDLITRNSFSKKKQAEWLQGLENRKKTLNNHSKKLDSLKLDVQQSMKDAARLASGGQSSIVMGGQVTGKNEYVSGIETVYYLADGYERELAKINDLIASEGDLLRIHAHFTPKGVRASWGLVKSAIVGAIAGLILLLVFNLLRRLYLYGARL
ncbi:MAG: hypothetical protein R2813_03585 [Flavobacteriales bacterium]